MFIEDREFLLLSMPFTRPDDTLSAMRLILHVNILKHFGCTRFYEDIIFTIYYWLFDILQLLWKDFAKIKNMPRKLFYDMPRYLNGLWKVSTFENTQGCNINNFLCKGHKKFIYCLYKIKLLNEIFKHFLDILFLGWITNKEIYLSF